MSNYELIRQHQLDTGLCSVAHHMIQCSTTMKDIVEMGESMLPDILTFLREENAGMNVILLLMHVTKERPYKPRKIEGSNLSAWNVFEAREAWLRWGLEKGYINKIERG